MKVNLKRAFTDKQDVHAERRRAAQLSGGSGGIHSYLSDRTFDTFHV
jgi:hypothetical protein